MERREHFFGDKHTFFVLSIYRDFENDIFLSIHCSSIAQFFQKYNCNFDEFFYNPQMKTIFIQNNSVEISTDAHIVDLGEIPEISLFIKENCTIQYTFLPKISADFVRHIKIAENVNFIGKSVITQNGKTKITIEAVGDNASGHLELLAIAQTDAKISVEGVAKVDSPYKNLFLRVDQTNILIGEQSVVRGVPRLEIATDDVVGGHSCKIHRLHGDALFYLQSHGMDEKNSELFLLNSEILRHLDTLPEDLLEEKCSDIHRDLLHKK